MSNVDLSQVITAEQSDLQNARADARAHLEATDWMVIRAAETGRELPPGIRASREQARALLSD